MYTVHSTNFLTTTYAHISRSSDIKPTQSACLAIFTTEATKTSETLPHPYCQIEFKHSMSYREITRKLKKESNPVKAAILARFFKTKKGEYGYGDRFIGVTVPTQRTIARAHLDTELRTIEQLLESATHEYRLTALLILTYQFKKGDHAKKQQIYQYYLKKTERINNWDLVDTSAHTIVGEYLLLHPTHKKILYTLARSKNIWKRRIAIVATHAFIRAGQFDETIHLSRLLLADNHDLIHKAVGWMLREVGKRHKQTLLEFLNTYGASMPRTSLRYALEHCTPKEKAYFMHQTRRT